MFLDGFAIGGYRSFGDQPQTIGPLGRVNLIAGQNNSGKSNILRFVSYHLSGALSALTRQNLPKFGPLDSHRPGRPPFQFSIALQLKAGLHCESLKSEFSEPSVSSALDLAIDLLTDDEGVAWVEFREVGADRLEPSLEFLDSILAKDPPKPRVPDIAMSRSLDSWAGIANEMGMEFIRGNEGANLAKVLTEILGRLVLAPKVVLVPAIRAIGQAPTITEGDYSGTDIIRRLADLQNPSIHQQEKKMAFSEITRFVGTVLDAPDAMLEVPTAADTIHVKLGKESFSLESLGTGIHEVTMLAAWATVHRESILCIEEPELHLHPLLQRKLLSYLDNHTDNQYLITTHSAHLLDQPKADIFHVRWDGQQSTVHRAETTRQRVQLCADLGYRAADLLQANAIVWVEGPSDRVYLRHWISAVDSDLIEGVHYSLMFYGGRLLSHLSANDTEVQDFIALRSINQYLAIIIDSDKTQPGVALNRTKRRVRAEFNKGPGFAWVTRGREIENYVEAELFLECVRRLDPSATSLVSPGQFARRWMYQSGNRTTAVDKVKVAHEVSSRTADLSPLDLRPQLNRLTSFIREANGLRSFPGHGVGGKAALGA